MRILLNIAIFIIAAAICLPIFFYLRMIPAIGKDVEFNFDCSFNYRMTVDVIEKGDVPQIDRLSTYPEGKNIKAFLPTAMYHACAFFHKLINTFKPFPVNRSILLFCSLCGSLIFFPIYFISLEIYHNRLTAVMSALLAGIIPAYLHRTVCYWYRYETIGTPILFFSILFFIKAFNTENSKKIIINSIFSVIFLVLALSVWRLSILFLLGYLIAFIYIWLKINKPHKKWRLIFFITIGVSFASLKFIHGFAGKGLVSSYGTFPMSILQIVMYKIGAKQDFNEFTRLVYYNRELGGVTLIDMFNMAYLSFSGIFAVIFFINYFKDRAEDVKRDILFVFLVFFLILTFIMLRNKITLGPLVAVTLGDTVAFVLKNKKDLRNILWCVIVLILVKTGYDSYKMASTRFPNIKIRPYLKEMLNVIDKTIPKDAVILCYWSDGYPVQTYCSKPTITDGLFESPEIVKRIIDESKIYYSYSEDDLFKLCKNYGATHILMPSNRKLAYAGYANVEYSKYYRREGPTPLAKTTLLYRFIYTPEVLTRFQLLFKNDEFTFFKVK